MPGKTTTGRDVTGELAFLTRALKAPSLREAVPRLADRAREQSWTFEEFLAEPVLPTRLVPVRAGVLIVTSNKPFGRWGEFLRDDVVAAAAMIERLVHHADVINLRGDSYRLRPRPRPHPPVRTCSPSGTRSNL